MTFLCKREKTDSHHVFIKQNIPDALFVQAT